MVCAGNFFGRWCSAYFSRNAHKLGPSKISKQHPEITHTQHYLRLKTETTLNYKREPLSWLPLRSPIKILFIGVMSPGTELRSTLYPSPSSL